MALSFLSPQPHLSAPAVVPTTQPAWEPPVRESQHASWNCFRSEALARPIVAVGILGASALTRRSSALQSWLPRRRRRAGGAVFRRVASEHASTWHTASTGADGSVASLLSNLPSGAEDAAGFAVLLVPRQRAAEMSSLVAEVKAASHLPVFALTTAGTELQLGISLGGGAHPIALGVKSIKKDIADLASAAPQAKSLLLFANPKAPAGYIPFALRSLRETFTGAAVAGAVVAPSADGASAVCCSGASGACGIVGVALNCAANVGVDACGFEPFGPELEIFEAQVPRQGPAIVRVIGTDIEGSWDEVEETEKGTPGIPRRKGVPAAQAVKQEMAEASVAGPKDVMIGVPGSGKGAPTAIAGPDKETWTLFPLKGVSDDGGILLGGRGPYAEGVAPKCSLERIRCFRAAAPREDGATGAVAAAVSPASAVLAIAAGAPPKALKALSERVGSGALALEASAVFVSPASGTSLAAQSKAVGIVALEA